MRFFLLFLLLISSISLRSFAQEKFNLNGTITDSETGERMIGATVKIKELKGIGAVSNAYGYYSISLQEGQYTIEVTFIGYKSINLAVDLPSNQRQNFKLDPDTEQFDEVVILAKKRNENVTSTNIGVEKLNPKKLASVPVLFGEQDVIKTLTLSPGVKTIGEGNGGMFVRGGNNSQNLILLDEATVYNSSHLLGFFSVFNSDAIKDLMLYKGTAPANYGGRISSVMDIKMKEGNNQKFHINGGLGLISSRLSLEGPIVKDKGSFLITGRRTYADLFLKLSSDEEKRNNTLYFYDLNAKLNYEVNDNNLIYASVYLGRDVMEAQKTFGLDWGNVTGTLRWNHIWNSQLFSNTSLIYSTYDYIAKIKRNKDNIGYLSRINNFTLKQDFEYFHDNQHSFDFGLFFQHSNIKPGQLEVYSNNSQFTPTTVETKSYLEYGAYLSHQWKPNQNWNINSGLRLNTFHLMGGGEFYSYQNGRLAQTNLFNKSKIVQTYINIEPRFNIAYILDASNSIKFSYTRNVQNLHLVQASTSASPTDIWISSSQNVKPEIGDQISLGYFKNLKENQYKLSSEVYYKWMQNQFDIQDGGDINDSRHLEGELVFGSGRAYGLELMLKKNEGRFNGWVSYTLSKTEKKIDKINKNKWFPARQDATHDISIVGVYKLNKKWTLSSTWVYNTGNSVTFPSGKYEINGETHLYYTERNGYRIPSYHRLDLGATLELKKTKKFESSLNFSIYNAYGRKNTYSIEFEVDEDDPSRTSAIKTYLFSVIPSITYNFRF